MYFIVLNMWEEISQRLREIIKEIKRWAEFLEKVNWMDKVSNFGYNLDIF